MSTGTPKTGSPKTDSPKTDSPETDSASAGSVRAERALLHPAGDPAVRGRRPIRLGPASVIWRPRALVVPMALAVVALSLTGMSVIRGDLDLPLATVMDVVTGGGSRTDRLVVLQLRAPRALTALLVGLGLGVAGALTQALARNPLATPDVLGIEAGAAATASAVIVLGGGSVAGLAAWVGLPLAALAGGIGTAALIYLLAWGSGAAGLRLVLMGIGVGAFLTAVTSWLLIRAEVVDAAAAMLWLTGNLNGRGWEHVVPLTAVVVLVVVVTVRAPFTLAGLRFGDDTARALGVRAERDRLLVLAAAVALASLATAAAGPIVFVALVAPQLAIRLVRGPGVPVLTAGLAGAVLVLAADLLARTVFPVELPVGVVTAALGAPFLLALLVRQSRRSTR